MNLQFERFTVFCRDLEQSLRFYRDTLGLVVVEQKVIEGPMAGGLLQLPACRMQIALLAASDDAPVIVGLFEITQTPLATTVVPHSAPAHGQTALVVSTTGFDAVASALQAGGYRFLTPPLRYPKKSASARSPAGIYREMIVYDPDNVLVSILQIDPLDEESAA